MKMDGETKVWRETILQNFYLYKEQMSNKTRNDTNAAPKERKSEIKEKNYEQKRAATTIKTSRMTYDTADVNS